MNTPQSRVECAECDAIVSVDEDVADTTTPCSACGSTKRAYTATARPMQPTNYVLDTFIAYKLSQLTVCGVSDLPNDGNWLNTFILRSIFHFQLDPKARAFLFNFLRRIEGASAAYREARANLQEYVNTPRNVVSPYFKALTQLEICISQCYQGYELLATALNAKLYDHGSGSPVARLQMVYVDSKHMDRMIHGEKLPAEATSGIWITNTSIESSRGEISFTELHELLTAMHSLAEKLCTAKEPVANEG